MKVLLRSHPANEMDWTREEIELHRLPCVGEYFKVPSRHGEANHHKVHMVIQVAGGGEVIAEIYCSMVERTLIEKLGRQSTVMEDSPEQQAPDAPPVTRLLMIDQAAAEMQVSDDTVRRLIHTDRLAAINIGSAKRPTWRIDPEAIKHVQPKAEVPRPARRIRRRRSAPSPEIAELLVKY